ncbi:MAG: RNA-binding protein [Clostridiales bacterium]|nr:MAG: RNA-binding protein [Clostridiales bacterium]
MRQVLTDIAKSIVNNPQSVEVEEREEGNTIYLKLIVDENDLGKVIGKQGRIAKAIRTVVRAVANRENKRVIVDILDHEETID